MRLAICCAVLVLSSGCEVGSDSASATSDVTNGEDSTTVPDSGTTDALDMSVCDLLDDSAGDLDVGFVSEVLDGSVVDAADCCLVDVQDGSVFDVNDAIGVDASDSLDASDISIDDLDAPDVSIDDIEDDLTGDAMDVIEDDTVDDLIADTTPDVSICPNGKPLGASCSGGGCECATDMCFVMGPLGGVCSECEKDADCTDISGFGCNLANPLTAEPAMCSTTGEMGESCETASACAGGLFCVTIVTVPGILSSSSCSECEVDLDCRMSKLCVPEYNLNSFGGVRHCVDPASIPDSGGCNVSGDGSECQSGQCALGAIQGIPIVGVCSICNEDADCGGGQICALP